MIEVGAGFETARIEWQNDLCILTHDDHTPEKRMAQHYGLVKGLGMVKVRDGLPPWLNNELRLGIAESEGMDVTWDLSHYWRHVDPVGYAHRIADMTKGPIKVCFNETTFASFMCPGLTLEDEIASAYSIMRTLELREVEFTLTTAEPAHAPHEIEAHAPFSEKATVIGLNMYPYHMQCSLGDQLRRAQDRYPDKKIAITETGLHVGITDRARPDLYHPDMTKSQWFDTVFEAVLESQVAVECIYVYPVLNGALWNDPANRADNGLIRPDLSIDQELAASLTRRGVH